MASTTITLPSDFSANILTVVGNLLATTSLGGYIEMVLGVFLAFAVIAMLIGAFHK